VRRIVCPINQRLDALLEELRQRPAEKLPPHLILSP
jgi:hypothetical protein